MNQTRRGASPSPRFRFPLLYPALAAAALTLVFGLAGCGGGSPPTTQTTGHPAETHPAETPVPPLPPPDSDPNRAAGNPGGTLAPDVEIYSTTDRMVITDFRIDFAKMKNVLALVGFYPDRWDQMVSVPLDRIRELQFRGSIEPDNFEKVKKTRLDIQLNQSEVFKVTVNETDGTSFDFFAIIPRVRGFRDGQAWNLNMAGNGGGFDRIVFRPKS